MNKYRELLFLKNLKGIGNTTINKKYVSYLDKINTIDECVELVIKNEPQFSSSDIEIAKQEAWSQSERILNNADVEVVTVFDKEYPDNFKDMGDKKPVILYCKGNIKILQEPTIAVVGTREPSEWSKQVSVRLISKMLEISERRIVSGLALGCDSIAHELVVTAKKPTIAILPSGVNAISPASNKALAENIIRTGGCLVSEYEPNEKATQYTYVQRDSLIAALSDATFVIECSKSSGTMHTVRSAEAIKRRLACYYTEDASKGKYDGNLCMIHTMGAQKVSNTEELQSFLNELDTNGKRVQNVQQITLADLGL